MTKDQFIEEVQKVEMVEGKKLSEKDYIEACEELYNFFASCAEAAECDLGNA